MTVTSPLDPRLFHPDDLEPEPESPTSVQDVLNSIEADRWWAAEMAGRAS